MLGLPALRYLVCAGSFCPMSKQVEVIKHVMPLASVHVQ